MIQFNIEKGEGFINVTKKGSGSYHASYFGSKESADIFAYESRVMCIDLSTLEIGHGIDD